MLNISVSGSSFDVNLSESYNLSIQLNLDGLCFSVFDSISNSFLLLESISLAGRDIHYARHEEIMLTHKILKARYKKVSVLFNTPKFTLVPASLYEAKNAEDLMLFCGRKAEPGDKIISNRMHLGEMVCLCYVPEYLYFLIRSQHEKAAIIQKEVPIIESLVLKREHSKKSDRLMLYFHDDEMTITVSKNGSIELCNTFGYSNMDNMVYYVLFAIDQLRLDAKQTSFEVSGDIEADDIRFMTLRKYVGDLKLTDRPVYFNYDFGRVSNQQQFYNLFNLMLCE